MKLFGVRLHTCKILNWMLYQFRMIDISKLKHEHISIKFIVIFFGLNVSEDCVECKSLTSISVNSLLVCLWEQILSAIIFR